MKNFNNRPIVETVLGLAAAGVLAAGCNAANGKAQPVAVPPAGPVAQNTNNVREFLQGTFPDALEIQNFCTRSLEDPSPSVGGSLTDRGEQWRVLKFQGGLGEEFTACTGEKLSAQQVGNETEVCDSHGNCAILDENFGQPLSGTFTEKDGSLKRNPVGEIAYKRISAAEAGGLRSDNARLTTENQGLREQISQLEAQKAALEQRIAEREQKIAELEQAGSTQQTTIDNLRREIEDLRGQLAEKNRQLEECQKRPVAPQTPGRTEERPTRRPAPARPAPVERPPAAPPEDDDFERAKSGARDRVRHLTTDEPYLGTGRAAGTDSGFNDGSWDLPSSDDTEDGVRTFGYGEDSKVHEHHVHSVQEK